MARFTIFGKWLANDEIAELKGLIDEAGCCDGEIVVSDEIGAPSSDCEDEIIIIMGTSATCTAEDLEEVFTKAANGERRAIWIWPKESEVSELPQSAAKLSYSYIPWDVDKLRAVAADEDFTCFETASGDEVPKVDTERNLCVVEKASSV